MTDWANLSDACGSAEHVPELLDRFGAAPAETWSELINHLCPGLEAYSAGFAAVPHLAQLARGLGPGDREFVVMAAAAIVSCARVPCGPDDVDVFGLYPEAIAELHQITEDLLPLIPDPVEYTYFLQALLSFEAVVIWDRSLENLADREYFVECPVCLTDVTIMIGSETSFSTCEEQTWDPVEGFPLRPATPRDLTGLAKRVYDRVIADNQSAVAAGVLNLSGHAECPDCHNVFRIADQLSSGWMS